MSTPVSVVLFSLHKYRTKLGGLAAADAEGWFGVWDRTKFGWIYLQTPRLLIRDNL